MKFFLLVALLSGCAHQIKPYEKGHLTSDLMNPKESMMGRVFGAYEKGVPNQRVSTNCPTCGG